MPRAFIKTGGYISYPRAVTYEILQCELVFGKLANHNAGAAMVAGIDNDIDAAFVGQPGIKDGRARVQTPRHLPANGLGRRH